MTNICNACLHPASELQTHILLTICTFCLTVTFDLKGFFHSNIKAHEYLWRRNLGDKDHLFSEPDLNFQLIGDF